MLKRLAISATSLLAMILIFAMPVLSEQYEVSFPVGYDLIDYQSTLPILRDLVIARESSTHDRKGGNDNGFSNKAEYARRKGLGGVVIMDAAGPGCVYSYWYSWPNNPPSIPGAVEKLWARGLRNLRLYLDGGKKPALKLPLRKLVGTAPFTYPLSVNARQSAGGYITYTPIPYEKGLTMSVDGGKLPMFFYHVWYHTYPYGAPVKTFDPGWRLPPDEAKKLEGPPEPIPPARMKKMSGIKLAPGQSKTIFALEKGGAIRSIRMKLPENDRALRALRLSIRWDGERSPSVDAPVSLFYAIENRFRTEPAAIASNADMTGPVVGKDNDGFRYFNLPMPFSREARVALANDGDEEISIEKIKIEVAPRIFEGLGATAGYFKTFFNSSSELVPNRDYVLARLSGRGHIVGTVLAVEDTPETFLEGDERIYTDGGRSPLIMGDATETYFNGSWYFTEKAFACPFHGAPTFRMYGKKAGSQTDITMYRFHLTDLVPFRSGARFSIQHGPFNEVPGNYRSLVFYYGLDEPSLRLSDTVKMGEESGLSEHRFRQLGGKSRMKTKSGFFEGEFDGSWYGEIPKPANTSWMEWNMKMTLKGIFSKPEKDSPDIKTFAIKYDTGAYEFNVKVNPSNRGVMIRRLFDQSVKDQKAAVFIDGLPAGTWFNAGKNRWKIWAEDDFIVGPWLTEGKDSLTIKIAPLNGTFTSGEYRVYSIVY